MKSARTMLWVLMLAICGWTVPSSAQDSCQPPAALSQNLGPNIFSTEQEIYLGDAIAEKMLRGLRTTEDAQLTAYLDQIGGRLVKELPPTGLRFRYFLVDSPVPDAFALPGGRIYVSRKMVIFAASEVKIASVLAHEIGHIVTHQSAIDVTSLLRQVLDVTKVSDRSDVFENFNLLIEDWWRNPQAFREVQKKGKAEQLAADQVAMYVLARAGYSLQSFITFFDLLAQTKSQTGNWLSDFFHMTKPSELRLREMLKYAKEVPDACVGRQAVNDDKFKKWQREVIDFSSWDRPTDANLHGVLAKVQLKSPLEVSPDINHLKFSPDGRYILAQSFDKIIIVNRDPFRYVFQIDSRGAEPAQFTPDSRSIVFSTSNLRVEVWDVSSQKRVGAYEPVFLRGCESSSLAPDGRTLACSSVDDALVLLDVPSGAPIFQKSPFHRRTLWGVHMGFSPDARYFVAANYDDSVAVDIQNKTTLRLRGQLTDALSGGFAFLGPDRLVGRNAHDMRVFVMTFPSGKVLTSLSTALVAFRSPGHGDYLLLNGGMAKYAAAVMSLQTQKILIADKLSACDIYDNVFATETPDGAVGLFDAKTLSPMGRLSLPGGTFYSSTAVVSADLRWLAISSENQGAVWDLTDGKRIYDLKQFNGGWFSGDGWFYADFPRLDGIPHEIGQLSLSRQSLVPGVKIQDKYVQQGGPFLLVTKPKKAGGVLNERSNDLLSVVGDLGRLLDPCRSRFPDFDPFDCDVTLEVRDVRSGKMLWSRRFPKEVPRFRLLPDRGKVLLSWRASTSAAQEEIRKHSQLLEEFNSLKDKREFQLLEVLEASDGSVLKTTLLDAGQVVWGITETHAGEPKLILLHGHRTLVRPLSGRIIEGRIPGRPLALSPDGSLLAVTNESGQLAIYNIDSMEKLKELAFADRILLVQFSQNEKSLFVLTGDQTAYFLQLSASEHAGPATLSLHQRK
jgi:WD40 repeat protein